MLFRSQKRNGRFKIHLESQLDPPFTHTIDIEIRYHKGYPSKAPLLQKLNSSGIEEEHVEKILNAVKQQSKTIAKSYVEFPETKEGMIFKLMQLAKEMIDEYALKCKSIDLMKNKEEKKTSVELVQKPTQYLLSDFINKINEEKERQKEGIFLKYVQFNLELPPVDDPEELKYRELNNPSRSRYRNEFDEVAKITHHLYLVMNKVDRLMYAVRKVY